jgi:hypothetical protein
MLASSENVNAVPSELGDIVKYLLLALVFTDCANHLAAPNA